MALFVIIVLVFCSLIRGFRIVVVGGGPAGLGAALAIADVCSSCAIEIWESRSGPPSRAVWFDITDDPWGKEPALFLRRNAPVMLNWSQKQEVPGIFTFLCKDIETALRVSAHERGILFRENKTWSAIHDGVISGVDLLIGADGPKSSVRGSFFGPWIKTSNFRQRSVIVDFEACPSKKRGSTPLLKEVPGALFAFRRFFSGKHCSMQLLLEDGAEATNSLLNQVMRTVLEGEINPSHVRPIDFRPQVCEETTRLINETVVTLIGDSVLNAHYRLGIGVNVAFSSLDNLRMLVKKMLAKHPLNEVIEEKNRMDKHRFKQIFQFQENVIRLEANCGFALSFGPPATTPLMDDKDVDDVGSVHSFSSTVFLPQIQVYTRNDTRISSIEQAFEICKQALK